MSLSSFLRVAWALFLVFPLASNAKEPLYWKAQKGEQTLLILGSIHVGDKSMYPLPSIVDRFLSDSEALIVEIDLNHPPESLRFPKSEFSTSDILNKEQASKLGAIAKELGLPNARLQNSPPWLTALSLQMANFQRLGYASNDGVDHVLTNQALKYDVPIQALETANQQLGFLNALPNNGAQLLIETLLHWDMYNDEFRCQISAWKSGDKNKLLQLLKEGGFDEDALETLLYQRNRDWVKKLNASQWLETSGNYTVVVGVLHLLGKYNVLDLLEQLGWSVHQLSESSKVKC
ncbi:TraB/GumN family protein [Vibrio sp. S9_S30]|uniref:TraB/GumN family protein n=1 Tax=Vibrio sp. S9_S30 TaxID=2720226 RepID=UPI0016806197|nr:TraB/GumN family protein [Vibrio sp. S9_S30]MBD1555876.1 TraB/GumN family protein [Vibrio sp. S9_S30]